MNNMVKKMTENIQAYILMTTEIGSTSDVLNHLKEIDEATRVAVTTGQFDILVLLEVPNLETLYNITIEKIHKIKGIKETTTMVVEKMVAI
jgi:DNA-binding Lrp family transcriptional regulator